MSTSLSNVIFTGLFTRNDGTEAAAARKEPDEQADQHPEQHPRWRDERIASWHSSSSSTYHNNMIEYLICTALTSLLDEPTTHFVIDSKTLLGCVLNGVPSLLCTDDDDCAGGLGDNRIPSRLGGIIKVIVRGMNRSMNENVNRES
ncbi:hypothetical protein ACFE04_027990 [Oxalis oulophora]